MLACTMGIGNLKLKAKKKHGMAGKKMLLYHVLDFLDGGGCWWRLGLPFFAGAALSGVAVVVAVVVASAVTAAVAVVAGVICGCGSCCLCCFLFGC